MLTVVQGLMNKPIPTTQETLCNKVSDVSFLNAGHVLLSGNFSVAFLLSPLFRRIRRG